MKEKYIPKGLLKSFNNLDGDNNVFLKLVDQKSDKFWAAFEDDGKYLIIWGKNDKTPYQSQRIFKIEAETRLKEKIRKGYMFSPGNPLLYYFQNKPEWFSKLDTSDSFKKSILAYKMDNQLDDQPKKTQKAFKI